MQTALLKRNFIYKLKRNAEVFAEQSKNQSAAGIVLPPIEAAFA
jgi:hypothetical protein